MHSSRMRTVRSSCRISRGCTCLGGVPAWGCTWSGVYVVPGGVPARHGVYLVLGVVPGLGGVPGPGGWRHTCWRWGVPGPGGCTCWGVGGAPGPGGCTWPGGVPGRGVCTWSWGGVYLVRHSPHPSVDRHTPAKT